MTTTTHDDDYLPAAAGTAPPARAPFLLRSPAVVAGLVRFTDIVALMLAWAAALAIRFGLFPGESTLDPWQPPALYMIHLVAAVFVTAFLLERRGFYAMERLVGRAFPWGRFASTLLIAFLTLVLFAFMTKTSEQISRGWFATWGGCTLALMVLARHLGRRLLIAAAEGGRLAQRAVIVGAGPAGRELYDHLREHCRAQVEVLAFFDDRATRVRQPDAVPLLGGVDEAETFIRRHRIDQVYVTLPLNAEARTGDIVERLRVMPVDVLTTLGWAGHYVTRPQIEQLAGTPVLSVARRPLRGWAHAIKLAEDYILGSLALLFVAPLMLIIAGLIKLDSRGPVFFRQQRHGFNNELIEVYKFRTMRQDMTDASGAQLTTKNDPRVTRLGHILRKTSLDELPQLFNVLNGTMSLVGPRPHALEAKAAGRLYPQAVDRYAARHRVKPGITGWAQVNGWRGNTDTVEKIERRVHHDLYYIENWSLGLDIKILLLTVIATFRGTNAF